MRKGLPVLAVLGVAALVACGSSSTADVSPSPTAGGGSLSSPPKATPTAVAVSLDPCQLVTSQEASALTGAAYGAGREDQYSGGGKGCVYGYQTLNVFMVIVAQAADAGTAKAEWTQEQSRAQSALLQLGGSAATVNINFNDVSNLTGADMAAVGTGIATVSGHTFSASAIYVLKGATFFNFSDLVYGHAAPSVTAMETQATTVLGRVP